jgi:hypothetical protein
MRLPLVTLALLAFILAGCGSSKHATVPPTTRAAKSPPVTTAPETTTTSPAPPGALQGEAGSASAGDIPDNQVFVRFSGPSFSLKVPEGWARSTAHGATTFRDKNNIVRVVVQTGAPPTVASMTAELARDTKATVHTQPHAIRLGGSAAVAATYTTRSAANAVTGKSVTLTVDRYELGANGKRAVVDLGTPVGVDNVDAYRLMIESLRLR